MDDFARLISPGLWASCEGPKRGGRLIWFSRLTPTSLVSSPKLRNAGGAGGSGSNGPSPVPYHFLPDRRIRGWLGRVILTRRCNSSALPIATVSESCSGRCPTCFAR